MKKEKGFTLVELLIVVAIIGILAAVLTPQFLNARKIAVDRAVEAYAHNVFMSGQVILAESNWAITLESMMTSYVPNNGFLCSELIPTPDVLNITSCTVQDNGEKIKIEYDGGIRTNYDLIRTF